MSDPSDQLMREIDEDLKREQWQKLWKAYGRYAVGGLVLVLVVVLAFVGWREYRQGSLAQDGYIYWHADRAAAFGDHVAAAEGFGQLVEDGSGGYPALGGLRQAASLAVAGDRESALELYDRIAAEAGPETATGQLARLYAAMLMLDSADSRQIAERLEPLAADGAPWRFSARELQGLLAMRDGDNQEAQRIFDALIADPETPTTLRNRASELNVMAGGGE
ncbi:MAG: tetratricopeptide repeat protein [Pseudomonadota bacterium]